MQEAFKNSKNFIFIIFCFIITFFSWQMGRMGVLFFLFSIFIGCVVLFYNFGNKEKEIKIPNYLLAVPIIIFLISRFLPFVLYGPHPLGYDTGFYNYNIEKDRALINEEGLKILSSFTKLAEVESLGGRLITLALICLGFSNWMIMYFFYILAGILAGLLIYFLSKSYFGKTAAFFSALIYSISSTQYMAFWEMFWKNAIGLSLMLFVFYLAEKKKLKYYIASFILLALIFITHKTTAFLLFITLLAYFLIKEKKYRLHLVVLLFIAAIPAIWLNKDLIVYLWEQFFTGFKAHFDFFSVKEGIFISWPEFLKYSFFYLPFGILSALQLIFKRKNNIILTFFTVCFLLIAVKFIFYRRLIIFFDVALIILSGFSLAVFIKNFFSLLNYKIGTAIVALMFIFQISAYFILIYRQKPLIAAGEIKIIEKVKTISPQIKIFTYDSYFTPWLYGFSGHKVIAPGWGDFKWNLEKWNVFWRADVGAKNIMLKEFKEPLIIYLYDNFLNKEENKCLEKIKDNFYFYKC